MREFGRKPVTGMKEFKECFEWPLQKGSLEIKSKLEPQEAQEALLPDPLRILCLLWFVFLFSWSARFRTSDSPSQVVAGDGAVQQCDGFVDAVKGDE